MIVSLKATIIERLLAFDEEIKVYDGAEGENRFKVAKQASITMQTEQIEPDGTIVRKAAAPPDSKAFLRKIFSRRAPVAVTITARDQAMAQAIQLALLDAMYPGAHDDAGHFLRLASATAQTFDDASEANPVHQILLTMTFEGGVYRTETRKTIDTLQVTPNPNT